MAITVVAGPTALISAVPNALIRVASDHAVGVAGQAARVIDVSSGSSIVLGASATYDASGADGPVAVLVNASAKRIGVGYVLTGTVKAAILAVNTATDTITHTNSVILAAAVNPGYAISASSGVGCGAGPDKFFFVWSEGDGVAVKTMGVVISTAGGSLSAGTPVQIKSEPVASAQEAVNAVQISQGSALLLFKDGSFCTVTFSGTSFSFGSITGSSAGAPGGWTALGGGGPTSGVLLGGILIAHEFDSGEVATFNGGSYVGVSSTGQIDSAGKGCRLQTRTAIFAGATQGKRVVINASNQFDSVDNLFTYDASGVNGGGQCVAMGANLDELLVLSQRSGPITYVTYLSGVPTDDPFSAGVARFYQGTNALTFRSDLPMPGLANPGCMSVRANADAAIGSKVANSVMVAKAGSGDSYAAWEDRTGSHPTAGPVGALRGIE
jgi:hypothetical protein